MRDIISYDMVANMYPSHLCREVQKRITDGWEPIGGPVIWTNSRTTEQLWYQAIVKRVPPPTSSRGDT